MTSTRSIMWAAMFPPTGTLVYSTSVHFEAVDEQKNLAFFAPYAAKNGRRGVQDVDSQLEAGQHRQKHPRDHGQPDASISSRVMTLITAGRQAVTFLDPVDDSNDRIDQLLFFQDVED